MSDHCRIGSLENTWKLRSGPLTDHCRIGSLESIEKDEMRSQPDHCRIGSLEKWFAIVPKKVKRSLPHRQLRKKKQEIKPGID